jgi:hypothetical protein
VKPPIFKASADALKLHEELVLTGIGNIVTYQRLGDVIGRPVEGATSVLQSARRLAMRENRMLFSCIRGVGLKRLDDHEIVELAHVLVGHVRRHARRTSKKLATAQISVLKESSRNTAIAVASVLAVVADTSNERSIKMVTAAAAAAGSTNQLPIRATLKALFGS